MRMVIGVVGKKGHGKDTLAAELIKFKNTQRIAFADRLKAGIRTVFKLNRDWTDGPYKEQEFAEPINIDEFLQPLSAFFDLNLKPKGYQAFSCRQLMQFIGTEYVRSVEDSYWVDYVLDQIKTNPDTDFVVTDVRYENEADILREEVGAKLVRVNRPGKAAGSFTVHASELEQERIQTDFHFDFDEGAFDQIETAAYKVMVESKF